MKTFIFSLSLFCLCSAQAIAADDEYVQQAVDLEEVASRMNVIKGEDYVKMTSSARDFAYQTSQSLTEKEAKMLVDMQNNANRRIARRNEEPAPEPVKINTDDKNALEELLTPDMYTYDDITK